MQLSSYTANGGRQATHWAANAAQERDFTGNWVFGKGLVKKCALVARLWAWFCLWVREYEYLIRMLL
ncbi:hypothetical protein GCM10025791_10400 [Halioxenophilus aromaticivorans]|uniref:Uncharacterized protein n=1 Tax=Halioxenophilus aromaticivorans TaxID=1306992 RepID=A0AAV3TZ61_9ALTE